MKRVAVLLGAGADQAAVAQHDVAGSDQRAKEAVLVRRGLDAIAQEQPADGEAVEFRHHAERPAPRQQMVEQAADGDPRLDAHNPPLRVEREDVVQLDADRVFGRL